jgi:hypothetical protein
LVADSGSRVRVVGIRAGAASTLVFTITILLSQLGSSELLTTQARLIIGVSSGNTISGFTVVTMVRTAEAPLATYPAFQAIYE